MTAIADVSQKSIGDLVSLAGRRAVVTGGARGLGKGIAQRLAEAGASVLIADIDEAGARSGAEDLSQRSGATVVSGRLDVSNAESVAAAADRAVNVLGGIDIWVNNAGIFPRSPILEMSETHWDRVIDVNLRGVFLGCREAARRMVGAGDGGVIVNIASTAGFRGTGAEVAHYVASKHGVNGLTRQLALELAPQRIRVLGIAPSVIATEGVLASREKSRSEGRPSYGFSCPLGREGVPDDIARVVLFCASDLSIYMTGTTLPVDAGQLI